MALRLNSITVIGRATRDAEMRYTQSGTAFTQFSVAYNHPIRNQQGGWDDEATFFNVACFGDVAERAATQVKRGVIVLVEGRMRQYKYTGQDGTERQRWEIVAGVVRVDTSANQGQGVPAEEGEAVEMPTPMRSNNAAPRNTGRGRAPMPTEDPDDLPF
jgi:single-strand DNA-binding protein